MKIGGHSPGGLHRGRAAAPFDHRSSKEALSTKSSAPPLLGGTGGCRHKGMRARTTERMPIA